ncbi:MAG: hypothetical protein ACYDHW_14965 [Syntrophorhabdaceae bacterium]
MKRNLKSAVGLISLCAVIFMLGAVNIVGAFQGESDGFGGLKWGASSKDLQPREAIQESADFRDLSFFRKPNDNLSYGRAKLSDIRYGFLNDHLTLVLLRVNSYLQYLLMKEEAVAQFGQGSEIQGKPEDVLWDGEKVQITLVSKFTKT